MGGVALVIMVGGGGGLGLPLLSNDLGHEFELWVRWGGGLSKNLVKPWA